MPRRPPPPPGLCPACRLRFGKYKGGLCYKCRRVPALAGRYRRRPIPAWFSRRKRWRWLDSTDEAPPPSAPTAAAPGSPEKLRVMAARVARGEQLFHPDDAPLSTEYTVRSTQRGPRLPAGEVAWDKRKRRWRARVQSGGRRLHLGYHATRELAEAALAAWRARALREMRRAG